MAVKTRKWILVVEDEEVIRQQICQDLEELYGKDIKIVQASNGLEAENKIKNQTFHLIITDIRMPKKDGEELIEIIREGGFNETTPIIAISAYSRRDIERKYPFVGYLDKPLTKDILQRVVETYFKLQSTEKMIEGSIFSSLVDSSVKFLKEALDRDDFEIGEMKAKRMGEKLTADFAAVIEVQVGKVTNTFSVLCNKSTLEEIRDKSDKVQGSTLSILSRSLGFVILKNVLTECGIIDSNEVYAKDVVEDIELLTDKKGIVVPINALNIEYKVFATTMHKDKMAA